MPGYSGTPLAKKLGIKQGHAVHTVGAPPNYQALLKPLPGGVRFETTANTATNIVHLFETERARLAKQLTTLRKKLAPDATVWVS